MITRFGMNEKLGNVAFETEGAIYEYSKKTGK
jgi:ATP-dependent Zn protease